MLTNNPMRGGRYLYRGLGLITQPGIRPFVLAPLLVNVLVFGLVLYFGFGLLETLMDRWLTGWLEWLRWLLWPIAGLVALVSIFFSFSLVGNLIASPFNGLLAEVVERKLTGKPIEGLGSTAGLLKEASRSIASELRKLAYAALLGVPCLLLFVIPVVNVIAPVVWVLFGVWMLTIAYADYPMANHGLSFAEQRRLLAGRRFLSLGFGGSVMLMLAVPLLNFLVIPAAVAGATAMWVDEFADSGKV